MIFLVTDFGAEGPYLGQLEASIRQVVAEVPVINLLSNAPSADPRRSAYLLAGLTRSLPRGSVVLGIVDPGVGGARLPVALRADGRWYVGPENGLFNVVAAQSGESEWWPIQWRPPSLSASFHGRDLFAPVAAKIVKGDSFDWAGPAFVPEHLKNWPQDLDEVVYIDHFGNAITGRRYALGLAGATITAGGCGYVQARTFGDVPEQTAFWYENSMGLVEIAVNRGRADCLLGLELGDTIAFSGRPIGGA